MFFSMFRGTTGRVYMLLCVMYFFTYVDRVNLSVAAPLIKKELMLSNTQLGLALSGFGFCYTLFQILNGYIGDRVGPRRVLTGLGFLWGIGTLATGLVGGLWALVASRVLVGLGEAGTIPTSTRAMANWVPEARRGSAQGFTRTSSRAAAAITPPLVVAMIPFLGWRGTFVVLGIVSILWAVSWAIYFRDDPRNHRGVTEAELSELPPYKTGVAYKDVPWIKVIKRTLPVTFVFFCHAWTLWLFLTWLPTFLASNYDIDIKKSALFTAGVFIAGMIGASAGGILTDSIYARTKNLNYARRNAIIVGFVGALVFMSCVFLTRDATLITCALGASLFCLEMAEGPIWAVPMDIAPRYAGVAGGIVSTAAGLAAILSPIAFGFITDVTGSYVLPFIASIALLGVGVVLCFFIRADKPITEPERAEVMV